MSETTENKEQQEQQISQTTETELNNENNAQDEQTNEVELTAEEKLSAEVAELKAKLEEEENRFLRLRADFDNLRRRTQLDREAAEKYRAQKLLTDLLPVIDNFERALQVEVSSDDAQALYKGIEMVYKTFIEATKQEGLEVIPAEGQVFDPTVHQAVMQEADSEKESGIVLRELQKGYKLKDRVLRPSMVSVNE
ncbi:nucleotide exchange factor GrpE [Lysinibacillus endophyticus]|uniref:Protein GrpE n=1 Tax=Ureibacillus endophyticus TaxID=1978490 RepID=A0A494Z958_9BACL|nr:nucleotide exchange factor GrpE [Lysinibacillus endophyticus]MCP1145345.1 nucleotide exchange factor GrpE [Lysinibacillus endophyticus]RKQ19171.1 nucleotide exchange factor GrpE [Lysinibacillus endophyticus]